jgi:hypothetical protein
LLTSGVFHDRSPRRRRNLGAADNVSYHASNMGVREFTENIEAAVPPAVYLALSGYLLASSVFILMSTPTQVGYAMCAIVATVVPVALLLTGRAPSPVVARAAAIALGASALYLIPAALLMEGRTLQHVAIDFSTTLVPIGFLVTGSMVPRLFRRLLDPRWVLLFFLVLLSAPFIARDPIQARLFEPPDVGIVALVATLAVVDPGTRAGKAAGGGIALLAGLATLSGSRSIAVICAMTFAATAIANRTARWLAAPALATVLLSLALIPAGWWEELPGDAMLRPASRIIGLMRPADDAALRLRAGETRLILEEMQRRHSVWVVVGSGHGAVFEPEMWPPERNISADGFVHNIHLGPLLMLFRYGLLGVALYGFVAVHAVMTSVRLFRRRKTDEAVAVPFFYALGTSLYMVEFLARNVLPDPVFSFVLAGHVAMLLDDANSPAAAAVAPLQRPTTAQLDGELV